MDLQNLKYKMDNIEARAIESQLCPHQRQLPHKFLITLEDDVVTFYTGMNSLLYNHHNLASRFRLDLDKQKIAGGGEVVLVSNEILHCGEESVEYGPVPHPILDRLKPLILTGYQKIQPGIQEIRLDPPFANINSHNYRKYWQRYWGTALDEWLETNGFTFNV